MRTALQLVGRVEKLEAEAARQDGQATVAAILEGRVTAPRRTDEELARTAMGRLLIRRRERAALNYQDRS
jgi:hypothetical protein